DKGKPVVRRGRKAMGPASPDRQVTEGMSGRVCARPPTSCSREEEYADVRSVSLRTHSRTAALAASAGKRPLTPSPHDHFALASRPTPSPGKGARRSVPHARRIYPDVGGRFDGRGRRLTPSIPRGMMNFVKRLLRSSHPGTRAERAAPRFRPAVETLEDR